MNEINLISWYSKRELDFCPKHFIKANTPLTLKSKDWIKDHLVGRFFIKEYDYNVFEHYPYFEDPQEAILYELTWS